MSHLYVQNIIRIPPPPVPDTPPVSEYESYVYEYDYLTGDYNPSGSILPIFLQDISGTYDNQHSLRDSFLNVFKLQTFNFYFISDYVQQYWVGDTAPNSKNIQRVTFVTSSDFSNQYAPEYSSEGVLQRVAFSNREPNRILWNLRVVESGSGQYKYWTSTSIYPNLKIKSITNSKDVLGTYFLSGTREINLTGELFCTSSENLGEYTEYETIPDEVEIPINRQIYLQKFNSIDPNSIKEIWINRGTKTDNKHYQYWKDAAISSQNTTYNVLPESKESLNTVYKK